jgi:hypothetical protein
MSRRGYGVLCGAALMSAGMAVTQAETWVPIQGNVRLADGTPLCAMVLANGQYVFSCDGTGAYSLYVPLDDKGQVTLFSFADGFAPFRITADPNSFPFAVQMQATGSGSPGPSIAGSWETPSGGVITFHNDGTYVDLEPHGECDSDGIEAGTYSYDEQNQRLTSVSAARDGNGDCGLADNYAPKLGFRIWRDGNVLRIADPIDGDLALPKIP